ncbi:MAG: hypothetical protein IPM24_23145 [Bryobacterales bacterium]|nr:hypothetical protein [Bryobacterales bacterium]
MTLSTRLLTLCALALPLSANTTVTGLRLRVEPATLKIRPFETAVIQVLADGEVETSSGKRQGRVQQTGWTVRVKENGGWFSKPFLFQGSSESYLETGNSLWSNILRRGVAQYNVKDSVLYTAPEAPGTYTIEVTLTRFSAEVQIEVTPDAPTRIKPELHDFPPETRLDEPYRALAEHYAPMYAQETWWEPKSDYLCRFDLDSDWHGDNNWDRLEEGSSQAYVYYGVAETGTHWFLHYNTFHARDYSDNCVVGTCHENDNEGLILTVRKDGSPFGVLETMETLAHNNIYSFTNDRSIRDGVHDIDGGIDFWKENHPIAFIESGGHGVLGSTQKQSLYDSRRMEFKSNTGVTYIYKGVAERPKHANDRLVGYDLLPIRQHWWEKSLLGDQWEGRTFDAWYVYQPVGNRPAHPNQRISGAFLGRKHGANKAKPFWGWHDVKTQRARALATGQWGLDPAYGVSVNLTFPKDKPFSLDYVYNPYLAIGEPPRTAFPTEALPAITEADRKPPESAPATAAVLEGSCEIRLTVDDTVEVLLEPDWTEYLTVRGTDTLDGTSKCTADPPWYGEAQFEVEKRSGRGRVQLVAPGDDDAVRIRIEDPQRGAGMYHITVRWRN